MVETFKKPPITENSSFPTTSSGYLPSQTKRFEISQDPFSHTRLRAVVDTTREFQASEPLFVGASLWGSLSKGKLLTQELLPATDIELTTFYDIERADPEERTYIAGNISTGIRNGITSRLSEHGDDPEVNLSVRGIAYEGNYSMLTRITDVLSGNYSDKRELNQILGTVSAFFGLDVGGGLKPYRADFFRQVCSKLTPDQANQLWETVSERMIKLVERRSKHGDIPQSIEKFYPRTFEDASHFYGYRPGK